MKEALLVVDVQNDVVNNAWNKDNVISTIKEVIKKARDRKIPIIWVQHNDDYLLKNTEGWNIVSELVPMNGDYHIYKEWGDAFVNTPLKAYLEELGVTDIVLVGAQSDACIRMTKHGCVNRGYPVRLVAEGHTTEATRFGEYMFSGEYIIAWENKMAWNTSLPGASSSLVNFKDLWNE
ncbi:MAG: isochorismatase family protein [Candidatus Izemoplasmatales bacterium]